MFAKKFDRQKLEDTKIRLVRPDPKRICLFGIKKQTLLNLIFSLLVLLITPWNVTSQTQWKHI